MILSHTSRTTACTPLLSRVKASEAMEDSFGPSTPTLDGLGLSSATLAALQRGTGGNKTPAFVLDSAPETPQLKQNRVIPDVSIVADDSMCLDDDVNLTTHAYIFVVYFLTLVRF